MTITLVGCGRFHPAMAKPARMPLFGLQGIARYKIAHTDIN